MTKTYGERLQNSNRICASKKHYKSVIFFFALFPSSVLVHLPTKLKEKLGTYKELSLRAWLLLCCDDCKLALIKKGWALLSYFAIHLVGPARHYKSLTVIRFSYKKV